MNAEAEAAEVNKLEVGGAELRRRWNVELTNLRSRDPCRFQWPNSTRPKKPPVTFRSDYVAANRVYGFRACERR